MEVERERNGLTLLDGDRSTIKAALEERTRQEPHGDTAGVDGDPHRAGSSCSHQLCNDSVVERAARAPTGGGTETGLTKSASLHIEDVAKKAEVQDSRLGAGLRPEGKGIRKRGHKPCYQLFCCFFQQENKGKLSVGDTQTR
ncbi:unnamed protein product [Amoebophrya sp. A120]|nr:unnamed protein product [Amoebophrya sp. A120]|eukprot:GSA120T00009836001.1